MHINFHMSTSGLVVKSNVAIVGPRVRFSAGAEVRHDVGGYHTCLSRRIPGFESLWRNVFEILFLLVLLRNIEIVSILCFHFSCHPKCSITDLSVRELVGLILSSTNKETYIVLVIFYNVKQQAAAAAAGNSQQ